MTPAQAIKHPVGITTFGSALIRVTPDQASVTFSVSRAAQSPRDAFQETAAAVQSVRNYLSSFGLGEVRSSQTRLSHDFRLMGGERTFLDYLARVEFNVLLADLTRLDELLIGVVDAGANDIREADLQTTRLKEIRAEARSRALAAARDKAEHFAACAGVRVGAVVHIEDVNPDSLAPAGHAMREPTPDDAPASFDPGSIVVRAAVLVAYEIQR